MQNTRLAFATMMGSAEEGNRVLATLNQFADITPFNNEEVIQAGRSLLNVGVQTGNLTSELTMLGDVASGAQAPLMDIVAIYAKAANKGKVQAEELNQMSERGIPVMQALAAVTGVTTAEVMKMGEKGLLSFGLLKDALRSLTDAGGQYAGLMEKQAFSLAGTWAGVGVELRNAGIEIGERAIPKLSQAVDELLTKLKEMKASGELDTMIEGAVAALTTVAGALKDLTVFVAENRERLGKLGVGIGLAVMVSKATKMLTGLAAMVTALSAQSAAASVAADAKTNASLKLVEAQAYRTAAAVAQARAGGFTPQIVLGQMPGMGPRDVLRQDLGRQMDNSGAALSRTTGRVGGLGAALAGLKPAFSSVGASLTSLGMIGMAAFGGWQIGRLIAETTGLDRALTELYSHMFASQAELDLGRPDQMVKLPKVEDRDYVKWAAALKEVNAEYDRLAQKSAGVTDQDAKGKLSARIAELAKERGELEASMAAWREKGEAAKVSLPVDSKRLEELTTRWDKLKAEAEALKPKPMSGMPINADM